MCERFIRARFFCVAFISRCELLLAAHSKLCHPCLSHILPFSQPKPTKSPTAPPVPVPISGRNVPRNNGGGSTTYIPTNFPTTFMPTSSPSYLDKFGRGYRGPKPEKTYVQPQGEKDYNGNKPPSPGYWVPYVPPKTEPPTTFMPTTFPPVSYSLCDFIRFMFDSS